MSYFYKKICIQLLRTLHILILLFVIFAWAIPNKTVLLIHIIFVPLMLIQWSLNKGTCYLTNLEYKLENKALPKQAQQGQFIGKLLKLIFRKEFSVKTIKIIAYLVPIISWGMSVSKICWNAGY